MRLRHQLRQELEDECTGLRWWCSLYWAGVADVGHSQSRLLPEPEAAWRTLEEPDTTNNSQLNRIKWTDSIETGCRNLLNWCTDLQCLSKKVSIFHRT